MLRLRSFRRVGAVFVWRGLIAGILIGAWVLPATAATRMLVVPFEAPAEPRLAALGPGTMDSLMAAFARLPEIILVDRIGLSQVLKEQALSQTGLVSEATALKFGQLTGAQIIIRGQVQVIADKVRLSASMLDAQTGQVRRSELVTGDLDEVFELQDRLASQLLTEPKLAVTSDQLSRAQRVFAATASLPAYVHYQEGRRAFRGVGVDHMQAALAAYDRALAVDPFYALAHAAKAEAYAALGRHRAEIGLPFAEDFAAAELSASKALALQWELPEAQRAMATALVAQHRDGALPYIEEALRLASQDPEAWLLKWQLGSRDPDGVEIQRALAIDPDLAEAHFWRGIALRERARFDEASSEFETLRRLEPASVTPDYHLGLLWLRQAHPDRALAYFEKVLAAAPSLSYVHQFIGDAHLQAGRLEAAVASYRQTVELLPRSSMARASLGRAYHQQRNLRAAIAAYRQALATPVDPRDEWAAPQDELLYFLAMALRQAGQFTEAAKVLGELEKLTSADADVLRERALLRQKSRQ